MWSVRGDLLVVDCVVFEGNLLVVDCDRLTPLLVYCSLHIFIVFFYSGL